MGNKLNDQLMTYCEGLHGPLSNGPVDNPTVDYKINLNCPACGSDLVLIPTQTGRCHSGRHKTSVLIDHYECTNQDCCSVFIDKHSSTDMEVNHAR